MEEILIEIYFLLWQKSQTRLTCDLNKLGRSARLLTFAKLAVFSLQRKLIKNAEVQYNILNCINVKIRLMFAERKAGALTKEVNSVL
jgi:hypothetical protein